MAESECSKGSSSMECIDDPPALSITLKKLRDLPKKLKRWSNEHLPVDILLLTVDDCEFLACYYYLRNAFKCYEKSIGYVYFGIMDEDENESLKVALVKCSKGSSDPGGSQTVAKNAVTLLKPKVTFLVGFCHSLSPKKAQLGDVVISLKLTTDCHKTPVSRDVGNLIRNAADGWEAPLENPEAKEVKVHCDGEIWSCSDLNVAEQQCQLHPEAIAVEFEGKGLFAAAHDMKMEWLVVKGVCDFAHGRGSTNSTWKTFACVMAASVVFNMLSNSLVFGNWPHYGDFRQSKMDPTEEERSAAKRIKIEVSAAEDFLKWCQNQLREYYNTVCQVKITPWDPENTVHINKIYVQLTLLQDNREPHGITKTRLEDCSEVFEGDEDHPNRRRILVYGRPGIGKSTFTQKLAVDWANGKNEILRKFALLLLVKLRDVCDIPDLCTMLKTAELLSADDPMSVNNLHEYVRQNQEKVLLVLDGYDEYSGGKLSPVHQIWRGSQLRDCCVMITTRPVKEDELRVPSHAQFEINGLDSWEQKEQFARKILADEEDVKGLLNYLMKQKLEEMAEIPLLLLMLCLLWKEKKHQLPTSRAHIYVGFIQTLLDHMTAKESDNVTADKSIDEYQEELSKIGKLAYDALLEDRLHFNFSKCAHGDLFEKLIHVGFFQVSKLSALNREKIVYFLHKSVQEFLAARFIVEELTVKKNETVTCLSGMDTFEKSRNMAEVLKFVCELSSAAAAFVFHHLHYVGEKEGLTNYQFTKTPSEDDLFNHQKQFILFCVGCLSLCPASDRTAAYSAFLLCVNHVVLLGKENTSTAPVEHFFKSISSFPNYLFFSNLWRIVDVHDVLSIMLDLNAVVVTSSGESKDLKKYADLLDSNSFLKQSWGRIFVYLIELTDKVFHSELLPELISAPVCSSQPPVDNLVNNENNIALPFTENHCVSLVRAVEIYVFTVEDAVLLKNVLPLLTAPRNIGITKGWTGEEEEEAFRGQLIESAINGMNFTDNLHSLKLRNMRITAKCAAFISESLRHSPNLRKLLLSSNPLHSSVSHLAENLHHVPQLTELVLWDVQMGEKECAALAASLKYLNKLEELNIGNNALGHGIIELAESLDSVPNLTKLDLENTNMGEDEASALAHALKYVPELDILLLSYNPLGRGVRDLVQHFSSVPNLVVLDLEGVQMTRTEAKELCTAINERDLSVSTDYHDEDEADLFSEDYQRRLYTKAELKDRGVKFRDEQDGDDDEEDDDDDYSDGDDDSEEEVDDDDDDDDNDDDYGDGDDDDPSKQKRQLSTTDDTRAKVTRDHWDEESSTLEGRCSLFSPSDLVPEKSKATGGNSKCFGPRAVSQGPFGLESESDPMECESQTETNSKLEDPQQQEEMEIGSNALLQSMPQSTSYESESCLVDKSGSLWKFQEIQAAACIAFAPNAVPTAILFTCTLLGSTMELLPLGKNEELVGDVVQLSYSELSGSSFTGEFDETVTVALSHCAAKLEGYEVVISELLDSTKREWKDLETTNVWENSDVEGNLLSRLRVPYAEARVTRCSTYAVLYRLKSYTYLIDHSSNQKFTCRVPEYPDVQVTIPAEIVTKGNLQLTLKVQEIPEEWLEESGVLAGPVLHITCSSTIQLLEPAEISLPMSLRADGKQYVDFSTREIVVSANSDDGITGWKDITKELPRPAQLNDGVVKFQVTHFTRFLVSRKEKKSLRRQSRLYHHADSKPRVAGFAACLCRVDELSRNSQLRFCCYPSHLERRVRQEWFSTYSVFLYGHGSSNEKLCEDDLITALPSRGLKLCNKASADNLILRFSRSEKYESEVIVQRKPGNAKIKFFIRNGSKCLRNMTIVAPQKTQVSQDARGTSEVGDRISFPHGGPTPKRPKTIKDGVKKGCPSLEELLDLSQKLDKWKPLGRYLLDMDESTITQIHMENEELEERAYQMLRRWKQRKHEKATYHALFSALCRINRKDLAEEFCRA